MISILLVEDHEIVRQGFRALLEAEPDLRIVAETGDGLAVLPLVASHAPDILILDLMLPGLNGLEIVRRANQHDPRLGIVVLSMHADPAYVRQALRLGAQAYVRKESGAAVLRTAVREVVRGRRFLDPDLPGELLNLDVSVQEDPLLDSYAFLSEREREVLQLTAEGHTLKETADRLSISPKTIEKHRNSIMKKLGLKNQAEMVRFAVSRGLLGSNGLSDA